MGLALDNKYVNYKGLYIPESRLKAVRYKRPTAFDLFAGCGGFSLGFMQAGFEVVGAVEWEPYAAITYMVNLCSYPVQIHYADGLKDKERLNKAVEHNWGIRNAKQRANITNANVFHYDRIYDETGSRLSGSGWIKRKPDISPVKNFWFGDIHKIKGQDVLDRLGMKQGDIDCVMGGPPCQGFSIAGKRNVMDPRNSLVFEFGRMILEMQPKTFVMENVPGILSMVTLEGIPVIDAFCLMLSEGGYGTYESLKKVLLSTAGAGVGLESARASNKKQPKDDDEDEDDEEIKQIDIFDF